MTYYHCEITTRPDWNQSCGLIPIAYLESSSCIPPIENIHQTGFISLNFEYFQLDLNQDFALAWGGGPRGVMVKVIDYGTVVSEFVLQSRYNVHFRANTIGKGMTPLIFPAMG